MASTGGAKMASNTTPPTQAMHTACPPLAFRSTFALRLSIPGSRHVAPAHDRVTTIMGANYLPADCHGYRNFWGGSGSYESPAGHDLGHVKKGSPADAAV